MAPFFTGDELISCVGRKYEEINDPALAFVILIGDGAKDGENDGYQIPYPDDTYVEDVVGGEKFYAADNRCVMIEADFQANLMEGYGYTVQ